MILIAVLFAPTVPSDPRPQNLHSLIPGASNSKFSVFNERFVTSSSIPIVNTFLEFSFDNSSNTAFI